jgi:hypothetical protein
MASLENWTGLVSGVPARLYRESQAQATGRSAATFAKTQLEARIDPPS